MNELAALRDRWIAERPNYEQAMKTVCAELTNRLYRAGVQSLVTGRVKEVGSLLKKATRSDPPLTFDQIGDKAGVRAVVLFEDQLTIARDIIDTNFEHGMFDDKTGSLGPNQVGYRSVHVDVLVEGVNGQVNVEVQFRTWAQHVWAEMSHALAYKVVEDLPPSVERRLNVSSALLEVFDHEIKEIKGVMAQSPDLRASRVMGFLEPLFLDVAQSSFDRQLSSELVKFLLPLVEDADLEATRRLVERNQDRLLHVVHRVKDQPSGAGVLLTQPEGLLLLHLLETKRNCLREHWQSRFDLQWLEDVADAWGLRLGTRD